MDVKTMKLFFVAMVVFVSVTVCAQDAKLHKYGSLLDSSECVRNLSLYREYYRQKKYKDAYSCWQWTFCHCPMASQNIMINGPHLIQEELKNTKDQCRKKILLDSLFLVYDTRIALYPTQKGAVLGRKANDYILYFPAFWDAKYKAEKDLLKKNAIRDSLSIIWGNAYRMYEEAIALEGNNTSPSVVSAYFQTAEKYMRYRNLEKTILFDAYDKGSDIIEYNLNLFRTQFGHAVLTIDSINGCLDSGAISKSAFLKIMEQLQKDTSNLSEKIEDFEKTKANFDLLFTPYAQCKEIERVYKKRLEANPNSIELLEKIAKIMNKKRCVGSPLFKSVSLQLYKLRPSTESAYLMGVVSLFLNDFGKAKDYFEEAGTLCSIDEQKAKIYLMLALSCSGMKQYATARSYAYKYAALRPGDGTPYLLIGDMYAQSASSCGSDELTSRVANWAAVDKYKKAKMVDRSKEAEANARISAVTGLFPSDETIFFNRLKKGQRYSIGCWINEMTIVR